MVCVEMFRLIIHFFVLFWEHIKSIQFLNCLNVFFYEIRYVKANPEASVTSWACYCFFLFFKPWKHKSEYGLSSDDIFHFTASCELNFNFDRCRAHHFDYFWTYYFFLSGTEKVSKFIKHLVAFLSFTRAILFSFLYWALTHTLFLLKYIYAIASLCRGNVYSRWFSIHAGNICYLGIGCLMSRSL